MKLLRCAILIGVLSSSSCFSVPETPEAKTLSALAPKIHFLCDFAIIDFQASPEAGVVMESSSGSSPRYRQPDSSSEKPGPQNSFSCDFSLWEPQERPHIVLPKNCRVADPIRLPRMHVAMAYAGPLPQDRPWTWPQEPETVGGLGWRGSQPLLKRVRIRKL